ncbi:scavenger receptor cysteine-rich domain-containing protein DMBT1-like [Apostichopus japonicus]|uniref:scavenger receptor cysteine-rich domain-containing protein DMBT1-like n=1 Tax=Stichopus japonicus TaxID=307972 RepID=UPI003AB84A10
MTMASHAVLIICMLLSTVYGSDTDHNLAKEGNSRFIVSLKSQASTDLILEKLMNHLDMSSLRILHRYERALNGFAAELSDTAVELLKRFEEVEYIEAEAVFSANQNLPWNIDRIDQLALPLDGFYGPIGSGSNVDVYVVDSGIYPSHNDFQGRASVAYNALSGNGVDCNGHGTHCAGLVGGATYGVAKTTNLLGVRVLDCNGDGNSMEIISGIDWIIANAELPAVVSISFSGAGSTALDEAVSNMITAGLVVVASSGNNQEDACSFSPGRIQEVITVAATDESDTRAYFSNYGACVDLFAPGVDIESAWIGGADATNVLSGTSLASPHVAGAAAIILANDDQLTPAEVKDALLSRAVTGVVQVAGTNSPNSFLYVGLGDGPNTPPPTLDCSDTITEDGGEVKSPNYPGNYGNGEDCGWSITAPVGYVITLTFDMFDVEEGDTCQYDVLEVYDNASPITQYKIGSYCGNSIPGPFISTGNHMYLEFTSDQDLTAPGFHATVVFEEMSGECSCPGTCNFAARQFTSPNYPNNYDNSALCNYQFTVPAGNLIRIDWLDFNVEQSVLGGCFDSVTVYDGVDDTYPEIDEFCGTSTPDPVFSSGNEIFLVFTTDSSVVRSGFNAVYSPVSTTPTTRSPTTAAPPATTVATSPPGNTTSTPQPEECSCPDTCHLSIGQFNSPNYPDQYEIDSYCEYTFTVTPGKAVIVTWIEFDVEQGILGPCFDSVTVYDGVNSSYPQIGLYCGDTIPDPVVSSQNNIFIVFQSDSVIVRDGFLATFNETDVPTMPPTPTPPDSFCGNNYMDENTIVTSPDYPANYPRSSNCGNTITAPIGQRIEFTFLTMDIEEEENCQFDSVQLFDGDEANEEMSLSPPLCGTTLPPNPFNSTSNTMYVLFQSDLTQQQQGFSASLRFF